MKGTIELKVEHPKFAVYLDRAYKKLKRTKCKVIKMYGGPESITIEYETPAKKG